MSWSSYSSGTTRCPEAVALKSTTSITPASLGFSRETARTASVKPSPRRVLRRLSASQRDSGGR